MTGARATVAFLERLPKAARKHLDDANRNNGEEVLALARVLIPGAEDGASGASRLAIKGSEQEDGGYLMDFGPKAKVIEGNRAPRPFVNPALEVTRKSRARRNRAALKKAIKAAGGA